MCFLTAYEETAGAAGEVDVDVGEATAAVGEGVGKILGFDGGGTFWCYGSHGGL